MPLQPPRPAAARLRDAPGVPPSHARAPRIASYERPGAVDLARASATYVGAQGGRGRGVRRVREVPVAADVKAGGAPRLGVLFRSSRMLAERSNPRQMSQRSVARYNGNPTASQSKNMIIEGLLTAERPMSSTQKVQVCLDEKKAEQIQAGSAKTAHIKEVDPNANITSLKGRESVKNSSRMRRLKLVPGYYWPMAHYPGVVHFPAG
ncbi:hypothetical protein C8J57DRAFT_1254407 [Mycena rebaudengoi]|nr:hypothetical protein C8J57DRAFT_1254407 [Mycena rebaudengoi]